MMKKATYHWRKYRHLESSNSILTNNVANCEMIYESSLISCVVAFPLHQLVVVVVVILASKVRPVRENPLEDKVESRKLLPIP